MAAKDLQLMLLPQPQQVRRRGGSFALKGRPAISLPPGNGRPELAAAAQLARDLAELGVDAAVGRRSGDDDGVPGGIALRRGKAKGGDEAYRLAVRKGGIDIVAPTSRGLYYGVQTLRQIVRQFGTKLPALDIADWPELGLRGVYHDISRGRVPTVETLKDLIELLAHLKVNAFSLYVEYPFRYERHPQMWEDTRPLTAAEMLELGEFCKDHCVDFIPSQASFGHLERLLSKPAYRHLANTPPAATLRGTREFPRHGTSLDPTNPGSERLLADLYDEFLPQFDSPHFNACCDEVWDLGTGRSERRARRVGKGRLFAEFICKIERLAARHGKRLMIWADILRHHPDSIGAIPKDVTFLNWWYQPAAESTAWMIDHSRAIRRSGHPLVVCPGVNNWGAFMPRIGQMRDNIAGFAEAGHRFGAVGLLNTEWGDGGHFNLLGTALPGFASGAEHAWAHTRADARTIGRRWPLHAIGDSSGDAEKVVALADYGGPWYGGIITGFGDERKFDFEKMRTAPAKLLVRQKEFEERLLRACRLARDLAGRLPPGSAIAALEWAILIRITLSKGAAVMGQLLRVLDEGAQSRKLFRVAAESTADVLPLYQDLWLARNHRSELDWSMGRFRQAVRRWRRAAKGR